MPPTSDAKIALSFPVSPRAPLLAARGICKRYGAVVALDNVELALHAGEVHAVLGENGAGKTTLMRILAGEETPDRGEVALGGRPLRLRSPSDARRHGVAMVHQHFALADSLTVAENLALTLAKPGEWRLRRKSLAERVEYWTKATGLEVPPLSSPVGELSVGARQRLEIFKALVQSPKVLILDEPTAVLTPQEIDQLFALVRRLRSEGRGVLFISHKLPEVQQLADRVTVLRQGRVVAEAQAPLTDMHTLAQAMVGEPQPEWQKPKASVAEERLQLEGVCTDAEDFGMPLQSVSFTVHAGEILGIAGVDGNGQRELFEVLAGLRSLRSGALRVDGRNIEPKTPADVLDAGVGLVPPDRRREGLVLEMSVLENLLLHRRTLSHFTRAWAILDWAEARRYAADLVQRYSIRVADLHLSAATLSGGNQQRVILARELAAKPQILVAVNPTRGLDFAATQFVYRTLTAAAAEGTAVVLISTDLEEILALSDRVAVLYRGRLSQSLAAPADPAHLGALMAGIEQAAAK
ncbi:MAG: ABC transporter ATP-binding protein [candidate division KSB1 bacterium]|nr:ABC transporter ATP-binding protein [candidate division KSB1 bacterium]